MCSVNGLTELHSGFDSESHKSAPGTGKSNKAMDVPLKGRLVKDEDNNYDYVRNGIEMDVKVDIITDNDDIDKMFYTVEDVPASHLVFLFGLQVL